MVTCKLSFIICYLCIKLGNILLHKYIMQPYKSLLITHLGLLALETKKSQHSRNVHWILEEEGKLRLPVYNCRCPTSRRWTGDIRCTLQTLKTVMQKIFTKHTFFNKTEQKQICLDYHEWSNTPTGQCHGYKIITI